MAKWLQAIGNSSGVILDKPILELLKITAETALEISTDGERLIITPIRAEATRSSEVARGHEGTVAGHEPPFLRVAK